MSGRRWLAIGGLAAILAAVLIVFGIGGSSTPTVPSQTVADAAAATAKTRGFRVAINARVRVPQLNREIPMTGTGVFATKERRGSFSFTMSDLGPLTEAALGGKSLKIDEVFANFVLYMRSPVFAKQLPSGKSWIKLDIRRFGQRIGFDPTQATAGGGGDPRQALDQLRAVSGKVERLGRERIRGVPTTHYRATVDLRRYPDLVPADRRAAARQGVERLIALTGTSKFPHEVWVDAHRLIRRLKFDYAMKVPTAPSAGKMHFSMTEDVFDFGVRVSVAVPSDDEVADMTDLASRRLQGSGLTP